MKNVNFWATYLLKEVICCNNMKILQKKYVGYGALFVPDANGDVFMRNSFIINSQQLPLLYEHKYIIGFTNSIIEDPYGLKVEFTLLNGEFKKFIDKGLLKHLSVGFKLIDFIKNGPYRQLKKVEILEVSMVNVAAQKLATFYSLT
jgi:HK97 family phage prohead protease